MANVEANFTIGGPVSKLDEERRVVWGWASVYEKDGAEVVDSQGDIISESDILNAAHQFVTDARVGRAMHQGDQVGEIVESVVLTRDLQKSLGIDLKQAGWLIAMHVTDDKAWDGVKSGTFKSFSIGGIGVREDA